MALSEFEIGYFVGILVGEGHFGGDGRQPQISLRMHTDHERLFRWLEAHFPNAKLYGPYHHGGRSYFQVEADRVAGLLARAAGETPTLFIVDELLRGTNSVERIALTEAVMLALVRRDGPTPHVAVIATHDLEVAAAVVPPYAAWHFRETLANGELTFDYRRREGPSPTRTGILVLEAAGAPAAVIADAHARAERRGLREGGGSAE